MGKPLIEKLKLIGLFALIGLLIFFSHPNPQTFSLGAILVVLGTVVRIWAGGHLRRDQQLTTSGPYQFTRNPFYLGRLLVLLGFGVLSGVGGDFSQPRNVILWIILLVAIVVFFAFYMPRKEKREGGRLKEMFGEDYETWKSHVPSLFPRLTPYRMNPRPWSSQLFMGGDDQFTGNKELWTSIATLALIGLFFWRMVTQTP
jgi:protein-S-isoprenylcysteine O-methyltransferase Ste14